MTNNKLKIVFAASSGGHFEQLLMLKPLMEKYESILVTEKTGYGAGKLDIKTYYVKQINRKAARAKRQIRVRSKISGTAECPRLNVFRSSKNIYAQLIDDVAGVTLCAASSMEKGFDGNGGNKEGAFKVGEMIAAKAAEKGIKDVVFDRAGYRVGYGRGFYDRYLTSFPGVRVGIVYADCVLGEIPRGRFDLAVDVLVTDKGVRAVHAN
jgi:large subunit ribosomal protein L18